MRTILFFDLPTLTNNDLKNYRNFIKGIKMLGFYMLQESVYVKMSLDGQVVDATANKIKQIAPKSGNIILLNITEKQFSRMLIVIGDNKSDVISNDERTIVL